MKTWPEIRNCVSMTSNKDHLVHQKTPPKGFLKSEQITEKKRTKNTWKMKICFFPLLAMQQGHSNASSCEGSKSSSPSKPWAPPWKKKIILVSVSGVCKIHVHHSNSIQNNSPKVFSKHLLYSNMSVKYLLHVSEKNCNYFLGADGACSCKNLPKSRNPLQGLQNIKFQVSFNKKCLVLHVGTLLSPKNR